MTTETRSLDSRGGFTLIEVLIAMLVLAIGLLGLEALGIGAARSLAHAGRQGEVTMVASRVMETRLQEVRASPTSVNTGESCAVDEGSGLYVCSQIQTRQSLGTLPEKSARVTVSVSRSAQSDNPFSISSYVFHPDLP